MKSVFVLFVFLYPLEVLAERLDGNRVQVATLEVQEQGSLVREVLAEVVAPRRQTIAAEINGVIHSHRLEMGMPVSKGQVIVEMDSSEQQALLEIAIAELASARVDLAYTGKSFERAKINRGQRVLSEAQFDEAETAHAKSQAYMALMQSRVKLQQTRLEKYQIRAPFDGELVHGTPVVGLYVRPGEPVFEIVDIAERRIALQLTPEELSSLLRGDYVLSCEGDPMVLVAMSPVGQLKTGMTSLEVRGCDRNLLPGQHVSIDLIEARDADIPEQSILVDDDGEYVFIVDEEVVRRRDPETLQAGESVIVLGADRVQEGDVVMPIRLDSDT